MINCETFQLKFICVLSTSTTHYQQVTINCCFLSKDISSYRAISAQTRPTKPRIGDWKYAQEIYSERKMLTDEKLVMKQATDYKVLEFF